MGIFGCKLRRNRTVVAASRRKPVVAGHRLPLPAVVLLQTERSDMRRSPHARLRILFVSVSLLFLLALSAYAQFQSGNIYGTVKTKDGSVLPGVTVTLTGIGAPQTFITDSSGSFRFL